MSVRDARVSWLSHTSTNTSFFPKPPSTFLACFSRGEGRKYARKKFRLNWVSNSQPQGHESDTLTIEPPRLKNRIENKTTIGKQKYDTKYFLAYQTEKKSIIQLRCQ